MVRSLRLEDLGSIPGSVMPGSNFLRADNKHYSQTVLALVWRTSPFFALGMTDFCPSSSLFFLHVVWGAVGFGEVYLKMGCLGLRLGLRRSRVVRVEHNHRCLDGDSVV